MKKTQTDHNLAFNGQGGAGFSRAENKFKGNQAGLTVKENYGPGPRVGNRGKIAGAPRALAKSPHSGRANSK